jgi:hypothetical protein
MANARGEVQDKIAAFLAEANPETRFTPYGLSKFVGVTAGSAQAACKALVKQGRIHCFGQSPLLVGRKR